MVESGQLALALDRDFAAAFSQCHAAISSARVVASTATWCAAIFAEMDDVLYHIDPMLIHAELMFRADASTSRTIISLKHLCGQLEVARDAMDRSCHPPLPSLVERLLCRGDSRIQNLEAAQENTLRQANKAVLSYTIAFLLEHGYRSSELKEFASRPLPT